LHAYPPAASDDDFVIDDDLDTLRRHGPADAAAGGHDGSARHDNVRFGYRRRDHDENQDHNDD
jgi:hypothetical protein